MSAPTPQPVLRVVAGSAREMVRIFVPGVAVPPFSVGTRGDWVIESPGVEPIHFFVTFDGAQLYVSIGSPTARLSVRLNPVGREWMLAQPPSAMLFGEACLALSQEVIPSAAPLHSPPVRTQFIQPAAGAARTPATPFPGSPLPLGGTARLPGGGPTGFAPVPAQPRVRSQPVTAQPYQTQPQPAYGQPYGGAQLDAPARPFDATALSGNQPGAPAAYPAQVAPNPYVTYPSQGNVSPHAAPIAPQPVRSPPEVAQPVARPLAGSGEPLALPFDDPGPTTLVDQGALRDHAALVATATPSVSAASAEAYAAKVRALATGPGTGGPIDLPPRAASPQSPSAPALAGQAKGSPAPEPSAEKSAKPASRLVAEWRRASGVMRLMIVLFPLGAYVSIWTPGEDDPITTLIRSFRPPPAVVAKAKVPAPASSQAEAQRSASSAKVASSAPSGPAPTASAPAPLASAVSASSGAPAPLASAEPSIVVLGSGTDHRAARAASKATARREGDEATADDRSERAAINAAFEGRVSEAARMYDRLATGPNAPVFVLAARLVRADSVRKPAISH